MRRVGRVLTYRKASIFALFFPPTGVPSLVHSMRATRLVKDGEIESAYGMYLPATDREAHVEIANLQQ